MKKMKQQTYNKMYLITPMVYEKIKQHLDKSDLVSLSNINKPFFNPKIEFHGSNFSDNQPPPPPPPFYGGNPPPTHTPNPPLIQFTPSQPSPPPTQPPPIPDQSLDDIFRDLEEMDWQQYHNLPTHTERGIQTSPPPITREIQIQTDPPRSREIEIQTEPPRTSEIEIQTDPPVLEMELDLPERIDRTTQTDPQPVKKKPNLQMVKVSETSYIPERIQHTIETQTDRGPEPVKKKIIPTSSKSTQTRYIPPVAKRPRKKPVPKKIVRTAAASAQTQQQPLVSLPREPVSLQIAPQTRELVPYQGGIQPTRQRTPARIILTPELRERLRHDSHYGQPVFPPRRDMQGMAMPLTYVPRPQENITQQEFPIVSAQTREINIPQSSMYYVESPAREPPGQREQIPTGDFVSPNRIIKSTFKPKKKKQPFKPTLVFSPEEASEIYQQINLPPPSKKWPCDICGAQLSSKYNLERHQIRERKKLADSGRLPSEEEIPMEEAMQQFQSWVQLPAKRTATEAKLPSQTYRKRVTKDPQSPLTYSQWN
jgi:hypothetical protein